MRFSIRHILLLMVAASIGLTIAYHRPQTKWEKMSVKESLDRLLAALREKHPELDLNIQGLSPSEIDEIRKAVPEAHPQFFELLQYYDFTLSDVFFPIEFYQLKDTKQRIQHEIDSYESIGYGDSKWIPTQSSARCCRHDKMWREKWLPIGVFNGDTLFIDMDPAEDGVPGQIVSIQIDGWCLNVHGYSFAHWLNRIAENVEQGKTGPHDYLPFVYDKLPPPDEKEN